MQPLVRVDDLQAGSQPQVKGIAQHDLRADFPQIPRRQRFDGTIRAHRHEGWSLDLAARQMQHRAAGLAVTRLHLETQTHAARSASIASP